MWREIVLLKMEYFCDENEDFELQYKEELELIENCNNEGELFSNCDDGKPKDNLHEKQNNAVQSPQLSQIPVAKRLFQSQQSIVAPRGCSTPASCYTLKPDEYIQREIQSTGKRSRRRLENDLFGDINDLYCFESYEDPAAKKARSEEERDLEQIGKILEARQRIIDNNQFQRKDDFSRLQTIHDFKMRNLSYNIPNWPFLPILRYNGQRIYCRFHSKEYEERSLHDIRLSDCFGNLLGVNKNDVWNAANNILLNNSTSNTENFRALSQVPLNNVVTETLWVEKYKPKKYLELLSDENTNRNLLYWLRMWDKVVFGREFHIKPKPRENDIRKLNTFNKRTGKFESSGGWSKHKSRGILDTNVDEHGRPMQKIALLTGPPGLGKTTLAHTIAQHAGYTVCEVNASDDRTPEAFRLALENGTQMSSVLNKNRRPNCIILDEIDGAPKQSIEFLVKFVTDNYITKVQKKHSKNKCNILKRPIICICNDLYDPALRTLRQVAFVVTVPAIDSSRLAERLLYIAKKENLKTEFGALIALAEKSGNDVRSCISTMQFFNAQQKTLTLYDVLKNNLGQKDRHQGLFEVWTAIFRIQRPRKQLVLVKGSKEDVEVGMSDTSMATRVKNILEIIHSSGDYERLIQGVYENYLQQKMPDPNMNGVVEANLWFTFSDILLKQVNHLQNYTVYPYLQYGFIAWHTLFATLAWPKINFPLKGYEFNQKSINIKNIIYTFQRCIKTDSSGIGRGYYLVLDTVPILKVILSIQMRSVDVQLLSRREKENLKQCVDVMVDLGLNYTQHKNIEGNFQFQLEPDIEALGLFNGCSMKVPHFARQVIAREVELENIRRSRPKLYSIQENTLIKAPKNHLQTLKAKQVKDMVSKDFFGRIQENNSLVPMDEGKADPIVKSPIWYRYKEGFNNAVRKDVYLTDLI